MEGLLHLGVEAELADLPGLALPGAREACVTRPSHVGQHLGAEFFQSRLTLEASRVGLLVELLGHLLGRDDELVGIVIEEPTEAEIVEEAKEGSVAFQSGVLVQNELSKLRLTAIVEAVVMKPLPLLYPYEIDRNWKQYQLNVHDVTIDLTIYC